MSESIEEYLSEEQIQARVAELAGEINADYAGEALTVVCVLKGSLLFFADLARKLEGDVQFDYVAVASYFGGTESSGRVRFLADLTQPIEGRHVLVVEDIVDTGRTMAYLLDVLRRRDPASVHVVTLLDKPSRRTVEVDVRYRGFEIPDVFVIGYGMDVNERYRQLPYIGIYHA